MLRKELNPADFDLTHGPGSLSRLQSLLSDSHNTYEAIGQRFGLSRQRIGQLARKLAIDGPHDELPALDKLSQQDALIPMAMSYKRPKQLRGALSNW